MFHGPHMEDVWLISIVVFVLVYGSAGPYFVVLVFGTAQCTDNVLLAV